MPDESMQEETNPAIRCGQSETSDPDFWALVNYGPADEGSPAEEGHQGGAKKRWKSERREGTNEASHCPRWEFLAGVSVPTSHNGNFHFEMVPRRETRWLNTKPAEPVS